MQNEEKEKTKDTRTPMTERKLKPSIWLLKIFDDKQSTDKINHYNLSSTSQLLSFSCSLKNVNALK